MRGSKHSELSGACYPRKSMAKSFRRERGDEFLETRVTAQGIPKRKQFQLAVLRQSLAVTVLPVRLVTIASRNQTEVRYPPRGTLPLTV